MEIPSLPTRLQTTHRIPAVRAFNFSPGPAVLPLEVLEQARDELLDWHGGGTSVMEISHRSKPFLDVAAQAEADLRELMSIPRNFKVLFMQGGASAQFALVPMNLTTAQATVDYVNTGHWSRKGMTEAARYCKVPVAGGVPIVADMSSSILSRPVDVAKFGLIYAGAQKNIGPAGLTVVIVREDLIGRARADIPHVFDYQAVADEQSLLNTPPTFAWYMAGLVFKWLKRTGGMRAM